MVALTGLTRTTPATATTTNGITPALDFDELRALIQTNLPGVTRTELDHAGAQGLLQSFRGKVRLMSTPPTDAATRTNLPRSTVYDGGIAYLRVAEVSSELPGAVARHCQAMDTTNKLRGLVLDLRFADGEDYAAAAAVTDLFLADEKDLLDWGQGLVHSTAKINALEWPVVVLVNGDTAGAAEALAALLRETGNGLILGSRTIGAAMTTKTFTLSNGQQLRIATEPVKLAGGTALPRTGLLPDIQVTVTPAEEKFYWNDPYGQLAATAVTTNTSANVTNRVARRTRTNEADLVRARKQGLDLDGESIPHHEPEAEVRVIRDPVLGRAVDLLKGLAVVRRTP